MVLSLKVIPCRELQLVVMFPWQHILPLPFSFIRPGYEATLGRYPTDRPQLSYLSLLVVKDAISYWSDTKTPLPEGYDTDMFIYRTGKASFTELNTQ